MEIIIVLIFISIVMATIFLVFFIWNVKTGQYDDTYGPSVRMLFEDKTKEEIQRAAAEKKAEQQN
jgi:cbb3-type cytochrome oxidase maturation protein